ncbi:CHAD domain-containing protein [Marinospirillum celere]|uniref:CHAD domain-containing protein n=1 Tax=Marinospirillum celere TaxID=1122252 RepID=A0A1I1GBX8_9GAMM|nr:CHAD domain-containing protein [Marinospirillum celere]SFC06680.1 CHAD domain-containing protein [Marinospirillum celere]
MKGMQESSWLLKQQPDLDKLETRLLPWCESLSEEASTSRSIWLVDTFDWNLWRKKTALVYSLEAEDQKGLLTPLSLEGRPLKFPAAWLEACPAHWWQLPQRELRTFLEKRLEFSSLQPLIEISEQISHWACRDDEGKILVRLQIRNQEIFRLDAEETPHYHQFFLTCQPLRGYEQEAKRVKQSLASWLKHQALPLEPRKLYQLCGFDPASELLPKPLPLSAKSPTETLLRDAGRLLFAQMRRYEEGILQDRDTEFLHQYRVHLRRLRSIFSLLKGALPRQEGRQLNSYLKQLNQITGPLRDLDVFLLQRQKFLNLLPEAFRPALADLFVRVEQERLSAHQQLATQFLSSDYREACQWLGAFFTQPAQQKTPLGCTPGGQVANQKIWERYNKICKLARQVNTQTPDEDLHELRIECKKLRYLMDFFAGFYPSKPHQRKVKKLKRLQSLLGDFNDSSVQQGFLLERLEKDTTSDLDAALHGLITLLYQRQLDIKQKVVLELQEFTGKHMRAAFKAGYPKR